MGGTVGVGMVHDGVVGIALHGLVEAAQNLVSIILTVLVAAGTLLVQLVDPAGLQHVGELDPLVQVTLVPPVTGCQRGQVGILAATLLKHLDSLVDGLKATQIDGLTRVILGSSGLGGCLSIRHLTIEVGHGHEAISLNQIAGTGILPVLIGLSLSDHVRHIGIGANEPPLIGSRYLTVNRIPIGYMPVVTATVVAGPVTHRHGGTPGTELQTTVGIELNVSQTLVVGR